MSVAYRSEELSQKGCLVSKHFDKIEQAFREHFLDDALSHICLNGEIDGVSCRS